jgi:hypothetical protein
MRLICVAVIAASLVIAPSVSAQPLAPGKPAGVLAARSGASTGLLIVGGLLVAGLVVAVVSMNGNSNAGVANFSASVTGTTS